MKNTMSNIWLINNRGLYIVAFKILMSILSLSLGGLIYLGWRSGNLVMFQLIEKWEADYLKSVRDLCTNYLIDDWIKYSMPDGLWLFSYMLLIEAIWIKHKCISYHVFLWCLPFVAIMSELLQLVAVVPGTFDIIDLSCYILAIFIFLMFNYKKKLI